MYLTKTTPEPPVPESPPPEAMMDVKMRKQCDWCPWLDICQDDWEKYENAPASAILKPLPKEE